MHSASITPVNTGRPVDAARELMSAKAQANIHGGAFHGFGVRTALILVSSLLIAGLARTAEADDVRPTIAGASVNAPEVLGASSPETARAEREAAANAKRASQNADCYQRFAVNRCLKEIRDQARIDQAREKERERMAKAAERQARSDVQKQQLSERQTQRADRAPSTNTPVLSRGTSEAQAENFEIPAEKNHPRIEPKPKITPRREKPAPRPSAPRLQNPAAAKASRQAAQVERTAQAEHARERLAEKRVLAEKRQAAMAQRQKLKQDQGKFAAPLPAVVAPLDR